MKYWTQVVLKYLIISTIQVSFSCRLIYIYLVTASWEPNLTLPAINAARGRGDVSKSTPNLRSVVRKGGQVNLSLNTVLLD